MIKTISSFAGKDRAALYKRWLRSAAPEEAYESLMLSMREPAFVCICRIPIKTFASDKALNDHLRLLMAQDSGKRGDHHRACAHYSYVASLSDDDGVALAAAGHLMYDDPEMPSYASDYDASRDDEAQSPVQERAAEAPTSAPENDEDTTAMLRRFFAWICAQNDLELARWALCLETGVAEQLGISAAAEVAKKLGVSKQVLSAAQGKVAEVLGPLSQKFSKPPAQCAAYSEAQIKKHWRNQSITSLVARHRKNPRKTKPTDTDTNM